MKCPACDNELEAIVESDIEVDICTSGCGGMWLDRFEFQKFDEHHEPATALLNLPEPAISVDKSERRKCPKCSNIVMMRLFHSPKRVVEIDECPGCAGIWLDHGELDTIRELFPSSEDLKSAREEAMSNAFGVHKELFLQRDREEKEKERSARLGNVLNWFGQ